MQLIQRIGYYLGGFALGLIILAFFLSKKKTSCAYGPEARVLKNINSKKIILSNSTKQLITNNKMDSATIYNTLRYGNVDFSNSQTRKKPCAEYLIEKDTIALFVTNCDSIATITKVQINP